MKLGEAVGRSMSEIPVTADYALPHPATSVGIEIEMEGLRGRRLHGLRWWDVKEDGSIINGVELVSKPIWGTAITEALNEVRPHLECRQAYPSHRSSVHVHLNVLDLEMPQISKMLQLYLIMEKVLFNQHESWDRKNNLFCVPAYTSYRIQEVYKSAIDKLNTNEVPYRLLPHKYAALNPNCINTFGTLEFRHMGSSVDVEEIKKWVEVVLQMKVAVLLDVDFSNPEEVFGDLWSRLNYPDAQRDIEDGLNLLKGIGV